MSLATYEYKLLQPKQWGKYPLPKLISVHLLSGLTCHAHERHAHGDSLLRPPVFVLGNPGQWTGAFDAIAQVEGTIADGHRASTSDDPTSRVRQASRCKRFGGRRTRLGDSLVDLEGCRSETLDIVLWDTYVYSLVVSVSDNGI